MSTQFIYNLTDTWNAGATTFTAIKMNVTDTASAAASMLIDLQTGGVSRFSVRKDGVLTVGSVALSSISGLGTGVATALAINTGSAGGIVTTGSAAALASLALTPAANTIAINTTGISTTGSSSTIGLNLAGTWNTTGTPTLILGSITDTASDAASLLLDLQVGTVSQFRVGKTGTVHVLGALELGHATDTTIARVSAGVVSIEGKRIYTTAGLVDFSETQAADSVGTRGVAQNSQSAAYTLVASDAGKHILHPSADTTARTFTIPANSSVAFPVGTVVTFINQNGAGVVTIAITTDTMRFAGAGTTGSRTLAANGIATCIKLTSTEWLISGTGLT